MVQICWYCKSLSKLLYTYLRKYNSSYRAIDNLSYSYSGNRLTAINDAVSGNDNTGDFRAGGVPHTPGSTDYTYWENGDLKSDANKGISLVEHDTFLKKISKITYTNGNWIQFTYDGSGTLIKRENSNGEYWEYTPNGMVLKNGQFYSLNIPEGRAIFEGGQWKYEFEYRDVWGNLRVTFGADGSTLVKKQQADFDVYGYEFNKRTTSATNYFKYQNQERIEDFGLNIDFFKYRPSDPTIGRFWSGVDPLAEQYPYNSTYALQENKFGLGIELEGAELKGFSEGVYESVERNIKALTVDLPQTIEGMGMMTTPIGSIKTWLGIQQTYKQAKADWNSGDLDKRGNIAGNVVGEIAFGALASKGLGNIGKGGSTANKAGEVGSVVGKSSQKLDGSFSILDWRGYPKGGVKPDGPFRLLEGSEYANARGAANKANASIHKANPDLKGLQIHEIQPVKFGGSPTDMTNKIPLTRSQHIEYTKFWNSLMKDIKN